MRTIFLREIPSVGKLAKCVTRLRCTYSNHNSGGALYRNNCIHILRL
jgi:hypothetical protein